MENPIDRYQRLANMTASPLDLDQLHRLAQCEDEILDICNILTPTLARVDAIKKYVFYNRTPPEGITLTLNKEPKYSQSELSVQFTSDRVDIVHGILGILSEGEELLPALEAFSTGRISDEERHKLTSNLKEEVGDTSWYNAIIARGIHVSLSEIFNANNRKLIEMRFKNGKYSHDQANNRQLEEELKALSQPYTPPEISVMEQPSRTMSSELLAAEMSKVVEKVAIRLDKSSVDAANKIIKAQNEESKQRALYITKLSIASTAIAAAIAIGGTVLLVVTLAVKAFLWAIN